MRTTHSDEHVLVTWCNFSWVNLGWISEFTIVVLGIEVSLDSLSDSNEVLNILLVGDVSVEVIFEVLEHIHVLLDLSVSSNSREREGGVIEFPSFDLRWLDLKFITDLHGVSIVLDIEVSRELIHLPFHLVFVDPESLFASSLLWGKSVDDSSITIILVGSKDGGLLVNSLNREDSKEEEGNS